MAQQLSASIIQRDSLLTGVAFQGWNEMPRPRQDIIGMTFGYWTIISQDDDKQTSTGVKRVVVAKCKCGTVKSVLEQNILSKQSMSCGCLQKKRAQEWMQKEWKKGEYMHRRRMEIKLEKALKEIAELEERISKQQSE